MTAQSQASTEAQSHTKFHCATYASTVFAALCLPSLSDQPAHAEDSTPVLPATSAEAPATLILVPTNTTSVSTQSKPAEAETEVKASERSVPIELKVPLGLVAPILPEATPQAHATAVAAPVMQNQTSQDEVGLWGKVQTAVTIVALLGVPFLWLTWRKRTDEAVERKKINDDIRNARLESDIRINVHRFEKKEGHWRMRIINSGRVTTQDLFSGQKIYADVLAAASSRSSRELPFPTTHFEEVLSDRVNRIRAYFRRVELPSVDLMSYNTRVRLRDLISHTFNPERRALSDEHNLNDKRVFGVLVREKSPQASTLVLCVVLEKFFRKFGDESWVADIRKNCEPHDVERIDQLHQAYLREQDFLDGKSDKSTHPWAYVYFPAGRKSQDSD